MKQSKHKLDARKRMSRLLLTREIQERIEKLPVSMSDFSSDMLFACASTDEMALIDEFEVFAVGEIAAKMGFRLNGGQGEASLSYKSGHACLEADFSALLSACKRRNL